MFAGIFSCTPSFSPEINKVYILSYLILSLLPGLYAAPQFMQLLLIFMFLLERGWRQSGAALSPLLVDSSILAFCVMRRLWLSRNGRVVEP